MYVSDDFPFREGALLSVGPVTVISHASITVLNTNAAKEIEHNELCTEKVQWWPYCFSGC